MDGVWAGWTPADAAALFAGAPFPWWVAGGWALEAAGAPPRPHADLDVAVLARDLPALRDLLRGYDLWEAHEGTLRPLPVGEMLREGRHQLWVRHDAGWLVDVQLTPADGDDWVFRRDPRVRLPLAEAGHVVGGVPYLRPEVVLLFKAKDPRPKDAGDLRATLPLLAPAGRRWLRNALAVAHPGHPWLPLV